VSLSGNPALYRKPSSRTRCGIQPSDCPTRRALWLWIPDQRLAALPLSGMTSVGRIGLAHLALDTGSALRLSGMTLEGVIVARVSLSGMTPVAGDRDRQHHTGCWIGAVLMWGGGRWCCRLI
ncbi:hypothetical protein, partial [Pseudovibrio exalbescens]|uniref:hypothetical protein n=1 Tax=Pseudovibrio exalbescens TaxID=197461 RepID=UPI001AD91090